MTGRFNRLESELLIRESSATGVSVAGNSVRTAADEVRTAVDHVHFGRFEDALRHYTRALGYDRAVIPAWVGQVQMLVELGENTEGRMWSDKALELFKNNGELLAAKSRACIRVGDRGAAFACSDASLKSAGSSSARWQARGEVLLGSDRAVARNCFERSLVEADADWFDRITIARIYLFHGMAAAALEHAQSGSDMQPSHAYGWYVLGQCQEGLGLMDRAMASYARSLELSPTNNPARKAVDRVLEHSTGTRVWRRLKGIFGP